MKSKVKGQRSKANVHKLKVNLVNRNIQILFLTNKKN